MTRIALDGKTALVIGGCGMIGSAIARRMHEGGARVAVADCTHTPVADVPYYALDLAVPRQVAAVINAVAGDYGRLDCLVNAAGVTSHGSFETIDVDEWDRVQTINARGVFLACQAAMVPMKAQKSGRIVNIGSVLAKNGGNPRPWLDPQEQAHAGNAAYGAAKAAVHALTLYLAKELAVHGITVNAIAPGPIASAMTSAFPAALVQQIPAARMGRAEEVAAMAAWLCTDENSFVTGEIIDINGGLWMD